MSNPCVPHNYKNSRFVCFCHFGAIVGQQSHAVAVRVDCRHCLMGGCLRRRKVPRWACWPVGCMAPGGFTGTGRSCCRLGHGCRRGRSRLSSLIACPWKILAAPCTTHGAASGNPRSMCLWCKAVSLHDVYLRGCHFPCVSALAYYCHAVMVGICCFPAVDGVCLVWFRRVESRLSG